MLVRTDNTSVVSYLNRQGGLHSVQACEADSTLGPQQVFVHQGDSCPRTSESGGRFTLEAGAEARRIEVAPLGGEHDMAEIRSSGCYIFETK